METCKACGETIEDGYAVCWKCGTGTDGTQPDPTFRAVDAPPPHAADRVLACLRCGSTMAFVRRMRFHEGGLRPGVLLDIGHLLAHREHFDTYACAECGKLEFFLPE